MNAVMQFIRGGIIAVTARGPYGPIRARICLKTNNFDKNHKIINKNIKIVNLEILKVKTWFWNKDLSSLDSIN